MTPAASQAPIGMFDSGVGGLSVLAALREELPGEDCLYLADSAHAPYGERGEAFVIARSLAIGRLLVQQHGAKALVVACNTATAAAVEQLRAAWPNLPVVGVEPAIKPAVQTSRTGRVGVLATRGTVASARFRRLLQAHGRGVGLAVQACDGLAHAIESSAEGGKAGAAARQRVLELCAHYTARLGAFGEEPGNIDTLVLGCTHYVFARDALRQLLGEEVRLIDTGVPVARQTRRMLAARGLLREGPATPGRLRLWTTGELAALQAAARHWLGLPASACAKVQA